MDDRGLSYYYNPCYGFSLGTGDCSTGTSVSVSVYDEN